MESAFDIYPNPANNFATIKLNTANEKYDIHIYSTEGKEVYSMNQTDRKVVTLSLEHFITGIYNIKVTMKGGASFRKLYINR